MTREEMLELRTMMKEVIGEELKPVNERISGIEQTVEGIKQGMSSLQQNVADIKQVQQNSVVSDNSLQKSVGILLDGMKGIQERFDRQDETERRVENLEDRVSAIEYTLKK